MSTTADPAPPPAKVGPETLVLRGAPRRVVRFRRGLLIAMAAVGSASIMAVAWIALQPAGLDFAADPDALYKSGRKAPPEEVTQLPGNYGQLQPGVPPLGPPLPGDLGGPILDRQRERTTGPAADQAAEAERQRLAAEARQARAAPVLFQISGSGGDAEPALPEVAAGSGGEEFMTPPGAPAVMERDPDRQQRKLGFINAPNGDEPVSPHRLQPPASPWQLSAGSVIAASLITGLNSDLPGLAVAQVTEHVYDSVTGRTILIPQGSRLIGSYDSVVAFGQRRALVVWQRIVLPDGASIGLDNLPGSDSSGYAGLADEVDFHSWRLLKGVALSTLLGVGTELGLGKDESNLVRALRESTQQNASRAGDQITARSLDVQPTITVRPGWPLRVIVRKDLVLEPWQG